MAFIITMFAFGLAFQYGSAASYYPNPPKSSVVYFDLEQLSLMSLEQAFQDNVQIPVMCTNSDKECSKQKCCNGEVACCLTDSSYQISQCGCKKEGNTFCTYPAPLAILATRDSDVTWKHSACLRENRGFEENFILTANTTMESATAKINSPPVIVQSSNILLEIVTTEAESYLFLPAVSALIFLDLEKLNLLAHHQDNSNVIQSPQLCPNGDDRECSKQECCHGEVACCHADSSDEVRRCGCKNPEDKTCLYRRPLAILTNFECNANTTTIAGACWSEKRKNEGNLVMEKNQLGMDHHHYQNLFKLG